MDRTLTSAYRVQLAILLASGALLGFGTSPRQSVPYEAAHAELLRLRSIPFDSAKDQLIEWAVQHESDDERQRRTTPVVLSVSGAVLSTLRSAGYPKLRWAHDTTTTTLWLYDSLRPNPTLDDIMAFLTTNAPLRIVEPSDSGIIAPIPLPKLLECRDSTSVGSDGRLYPFWACNSEAQIHATKSETRPHFTLYLTQPPWYIDYVLAATVPGKERVILGTTVHEWLERRGALRSVSSTAGGRPGYLPALLGIWTEVRALTLAQADAFLLNRVAETRQTLTFLGLSVDETMAGVAGPMLLLLLLLYFRVHIVHCLRLAGESDRSSAGAYPWALLFPDRTSKALRIGVVITPLAACIPLLFRGLRTEAGFLEWVSLGIVVLLLAETLIVYIHVSRLAQFAHPDAVYRKSVIDANDTEKFASAHSPAPDVNVIKKA